MSKHLTKQQKRLELRTTEFDKMPAEKKRGLKRPGSMNRHKTYSIK